MRLNVGGQKGRSKGSFKGWTIVDTRDGADIKIDIMNRKLPVPDSSVEAIYTSHTLEHIFPDKLPFVLSECRRVLKPGRPFRTVVPDIDKAIQAYIHEDHSFLTDKRNPRKPEFLPQHNICYLSSWFFTYSLKKNKRRLSGGHVMVFNFDLMKYYLKEAGFDSIKLLMFKKCNPIFDGCDFERYKDCSLYVECEKKHET